MSAAIRQTSKRPRVLVASASVGAGHNSVAQAIRQALQQAAAPIDVEQEDVLSFTPRPFRTYYAGGFALGMTRMPRLYGLGFRLTDHPQRAGRTVIEKRRLWTERQAMRRFQRHLRWRRPDLVVNTHFLAAPMIGWMIRRGRLQTRQIVVVTDIQVHRFWYAQTVSHWYVPAPCSADTLRRWGIPDEQITISGIPIHAKWTEPLDRHRILAQWGLPADRQIVLLTGGTVFTCGPVGKIARDILQACGDAHLVVLAGRNKKLLAELAPLAAKEPRLKPVSYTDRVHELVEAACLMITKAGGVTTAECLAKGTPMVLLPPVPGHERGNAEYLAREGAAVIAEKVEAAPGTVKALLQDKDVLERLSAGARRLYRPATETIVEAVQRTCGRIATG